LKTGVHRSRRAVIPATTAAENASGPGNGEAISVQIKPYLQLVRAPAVFSAVSNIIAAQLIVTGGVLQWRTTTLLTAISVCLYTGGFVLNDCFDYEQDRLERPYRPLPSGQVSLGSARVLAAALLASAVFMSFFLGAVQVGIVGLLVALIAIYDVLAKDKAVGNLVMGACRYMNWLLGLSTAGLGLTVLLIPVPVFTYVASLTALSRTETGKRGHAIPVSVYIGLVASVVTFLALILSGILVNVWSLLLLVPAVWLLLVRILQLHRYWSPGKAQQTVGMMIFGIIPLDAILVCAAGPWWGSIVVIVLLLPARYIGRALYVT
jgi:4-hydroxybenzoate polyprenyltransferase